MQSIRYVRTHEDGFSVRYRGREFGRIWRDDEYYVWWVEFDPAAYSEPCEGGERGARRLLRDWVESRDMYQWWGVHTGAKEA